MKAYKLIATVTAVLLTFASLSAIDYNVALQPATPDTGLTLHVTQFAPIHVYPSADQLRELSALAAGVDPGTTLASTSGAHTDEASASFNLVGSALSMPRYSFGQKFDRVSKE